MSLPSIMAPSRIVYLDSCPETSASNRAGFVHCNWAQKGAPDGSVDRASNPDVTEAGVNLDLDLIQAALILEI